jgi:hypothetical protein
MDSLDRRKLYFDQPGACPLGESQLALVHGICGSKLVSVGHHAMVFDGRHTEQIGNSEKRMILDFGFRIPDLLLNIGGNCKTFEKGPKGRQWVAPSVSSGYWLHI